MASSGWQNEQWVINCNSNVSYYGNIYIKSITHTGTNLRIVGGIALCTRGTSGYRYDWQNNIYANLNSTDYLVRRSDIGGVYVGTDSYANSGRAGGSYFDDDAFDITFTNVSATATSYELSANFHSYNINKTLKWTLSIPTGASAPSGASIAYNSCTWNSATATTSVTSTGGATCTYDLAVVTGTYNGAADSITGWVGEGRKWVSNSGGQTVVSDSTYTGSADSPIAIKGLLHYKLGLNVKNSAGNATAFDSTLRYLPPAPGQFSYAEQGTGTKTYTVNYVGSTTNNHSTYDAAELTRTVRYKIGSDQWTYVTQTATTTDTVTTFTVVVPAGQMATVEAWETYHGMGGGTQMITLVNTDSPVSLYGSVNGETKALGPIYGSVNGRAKKLIKIYTSVGGVTKKVYEDV